MAVSTIYQSNKTTQTNKHTTVIIYALILLGLAALVFFGYDFVKNLTNLGGKSALNADVFYGKAEVYLDGTLLGNTPYESKEIKPGEHTVLIKDGQVEYEVTLDFVRNTELVLKRDLGISSVFSAGQNFWFDTSGSDDVFSVISEPASADVYIDGEKVGTTPFTSSDLSSGGYDIRVEKSGYEAQSARIEVDKEHKLNISTVLFPNPVPEKVTLLEGSTTLYDIYSDNLTVTSNKNDWADAVAYFNKTRGINLADVGVNREPVFDYFIDFDGILYNSEGTKVSIDNADFMAEATKGAYLRKLSDGDGLSEAAKNTFLALENAGVASGKTATILETGTGWLRVRDEPGLNGSELSKATVGEEYSVLEEAPGWVKIKISDAVEGWVSDTYVDLN